MSSSSLKAIIAPSLLSCDFARLSEEARNIFHDCGADWLHMDVMDGHFVPNLTIGAPVIKALRPHTTAFLDCHLMVSKPEQWVQDFAKAGANSFTFHIEATSNAEELIRNIHDAGMKAGIAVKPKTNVDTVMELAPLVDMILIMSVEPGFGGQAFMPEVCTKIAQLRKNFPDLNIQVDGGINGENIDVVAQAGANVIVAGTYVFKAEDRGARISRLRSGVEKVCNQ